MNPITMRCATKISKFAYAVLIALLLLFGTYLYRSTSARTFNIAVRGSSSLTNCSTGKYGVISDNNGQVSSVPCKPGDILDVRNIMRFRLYYVVKGDETVPISFRKDGFKILANERLCGLLLETNAAFEWLRNASDEGIGSVCFVAVSLRCKGMLDALKRLKANGVVYWFTRGMFSELHASWEDFNPYGLIVATDNGFKPTMLSGYEKLEFLLLYFTKNVQHLDEIAKLPKLKNLCLQYCGNDIDLSPLKELRELAVLSLRGFGEFTNLSPISGIPSLRAIDLIECNSVVDLSPIGELMGIESVYLYSCEEIKDLSPLENMASLTSLAIRHCELIDDITLLSG